MVLALGLAATTARATDVDWRLTGTGSVGGHPTQVIGSPQVVREPGGAAVRFGGRGDGLIVLANPLAGWRSFTVQVLFRPAGDGLPEPRFIHLEDDAGERMTFELRLTPDRRWALDTFLTTGSQSRQLLDRARLHGSGRWHWAAIVYDGDARRMSSYVDGRPELAGALAFTPFVAGRVGIGFRLNRLYWYRGEIRELKFHSSALPPSALAREAAGADTP